ncbi:uncharacterized protein LOC129105180 [Anoplopoma fimbria]|uniref:uncharacterized protein LOC129105180 n=1 Tax=Anoplopoma fimbria TaxID=229290 RepID=UPI0023ED1C1F|nr:uncharacterized protein LOC129105180 [Anoplopoma fimbria]
MCGLCLLSQGRPRMSGTSGESMIKNESISVWLPDIVRLRAGVRWVTRQRGTGSGSGISWSCFANPRSKKLSSAPESTNTASSRETSGEVRRAWVKGLEGLGEVEVRLTNNPLLIDEPGLLMDMKPKNYPASRSKGISLPYCGTDVPQKRGGCAQAAWVPPDHWETMWRCPLPSLDQKEEQKGRKAEWQRLPPSSWRSIGESSLLHPPLMESIVNLYGQGDQRIEVGRQIKWGQVILNVLRKTVQERVR